MKKDDSNITISVIKKKSTDSDTLTKWTAIISSFTGVVSLIIAMVSAYYSSKSAESSQKSTNASIEHNKKSVQPLLTLFPNGEKDAKAYGIYLQNQGLGPARITSIKINGKEYSTLFHKEWLDLFYEFHLINNENRQKTDLSAQRQCEKRFSDIVEQEIELVQQTGNSEFEKRGEVDQARELKNFLTKNCHNPIAVQKTYSFLGCLKTGSLEKGTIVSVGTDKNILLEVIHSKLEDEKCTNGIINFSKWLISTGFEIKYESPFYNDDFLKGSTKISNF